VISNGKEARILLYYSVENTCEEIQRYSPHDAKQYAQFINFWQRVTNVINPVFNVPPKSLLDIGGNFDFGKLKDPFSLIGPPDKTLEFMRTLFDGTEYRANQGVISSITDNQVA
jgi:phytoene dehydrogenase-like protein